MKNVIVNIMVRVLEKLLLFLMWLMMNPDEWRKTKEDLQKPTSMEIERIRLEHVLKEWKEKEGKRNESNR